MLDIIFGWGLETAGSSYFSHGNTSEAAKSRWKTSAQREWSALHATKPKIGGYKLLLLHYSLFTPEQVSSQQRENFSYRKSWVERIELSAESFEGASLGNVLVLPQEIVHSLSSLKTSITPRTREWRCPSTLCSKGNLVPGWCLREVILPPTSARSWAGTWAHREMGGFDLARACPAVPHHEDSCLVMLQCRLHLLELQDWNHRVIQSREHQDRRKNHFVIQMGWEEEHVFNPRSGMFTHRVFPEGCLVWGPADCMEQTDLLPRS